MSELPAPEPPAAAPVARGLFHDRQMAGKSPLEQAKEALICVTGRIRNNPAIGWHMGPGTQAWSLVTEAVASVLSMPLDQVRRNTVCPGAVDPARGLRELVEVLDEILHAHAIGQRLRERAILALDRVKGLDRASEEGAEG